MSENLVGHIGDTIKDLPEEELSAMAGEEDGHDPIAEATLPLDDLTENDSPAKVEAALRKVMPTLDSVDPLRRVTIRAASIKKLEKIGVSAPAKLVDAAFQMENDGTPDQQQGRPVLFDDPEPWPDVVDGAVLLDDITATLKRFIVLPPHAVEAVSLWILHACALEAFTISPLLTINSATKRAGKTLLLEIVSLLMPRCLFASNITAAALFRAVDKFKPCLLVDEADTFLRDSDELRGILNASHRKASAFVVRTVGDEHEPTLFVSWCAKVIALIGKLPGTLEDRSILIPMRRKGPGERVERFRSEKKGPKLEILKRKVMRWTADNYGGLSKADPEAPGELNDRAMDNWRPLLAVGELAGGAWAEKSRAAARMLSGTVDEAANSAPIQLLADLKTLFSERDTDRLSSADICEVLGAMEDRPWPEWKRGNPITPRQLAKLLGGFDVIPRTIRTGDETAKGYKLEQLIDPFSRYLPSPSVTTPQATPSLGLRDISDPTQDPSVTDKKAKLIPYNIKDVTDVTDRNTLFPDFEEGGSEKLEQGVLAHKSRSGKWTQEY